MDTAAWPDTTAWPDTAVWPDSAARPDSVSWPDTAAWPDQGRPDLKLKPDRGGPTTTGWVVAAGGTGKDYGNSIAVDGSGQVYFAGEFPHVATFGASTLTTRGAYDAFVARLNRNGRFLWAVQAGSEQGDGAKSIAVDSAGNSTITGQCADKATFGSISLSTKSSTNIFVARLNRGGRYLWATPASGSRTTSSSSVALDRWGNSFVTGYFGIEAIFGSTTLTANASGVDAFVAKLDRDGKFIWAASAGGDGLDRSNAVVADALGNSYVIGDYEGVATFGSTSLPSRGHWDVFVAKLDQGGRFLWAVSAGGASHDSGSAIALDSSGFLYTSGWFSGTTDFGATTLTSLGDSDIFVAKLDPGGQFLWAVSAGGASSDIGRSIAVDITGSCYVTGWFTKTAYFGSRSVVSRGAQDIFLARLDPSARFISATSAGGMFADSASSIALDGSGNILLTGPFQTTATFGSTTLNARGDSDVFVAKLNRTAEF